jgi:hypothetical protein
MYVGRQVELIWDRNMKLVILFKSIMPFRATYLEQRIILLTHKCAL